MLTTSKRAELEQAAADSTGTITEYQQKKYIRINKLWYECSDSVQEYNSLSPISVSYKEDGTVSDLCTGGGRGKTSGREPAHLFSETDCSKSSLSLRMERACQQIR